MKDHGRAVRRGRCDLEEPCLIDTPPKAPRPITLGELARATASYLQDAGDSPRVVTRPAPLHRAGRGAVAVFDGRIDADHLLATRAEACFVTSDHAHLVPAKTAALIADHPLEAFRCAVTLLLPGSSRLVSAASHLGIHADAFVDRAALIERDVTIEPGAIVGPGVEIGSGTFIGAHAVIAAGVCIGRGCAIAAGASIAHALLGDRIVVHAGASIGSPEVGLAPGSGRGVQLGRVIIQDDAEIGANSVVQRGMLGDTVIGEGSSVAALTLVPCDQVVDRRASARET